MRMSFRSPDVTIRGAAQTARSVSNTPITATPAAN
jgi:hypothetical protein